MMTCKHVARGALPLPRVPQCRAKACTPGFRCGRVWDVRAGELHFQSREL